MEATPEISQSHSTGLTTLLLLLRFHGIAADDGQIIHQYGRTIGLVEMLRCAKDLKLKARVIQSNWERLGRTALPAIGERPDGSFFLIARMVDDKILISDPVAGRPQLITRSELESGWNGKLLLITRRASLTDTIRRFDITWFLQA